jgi:hypothetical protein
MIDEQDVVEGESFARLGFETFNFEFVARSDAILFTAGF